MANEFSLACLLQRTAVLQLGVLQGNTPDYLSPTLLWFVGQVSFLAGSERPGLQLPLAEGARASCEQCPRMAVLKDDQRLSIICIGPCITRPLVGRKQLVFSILRILLLEK